MVIPDNIIWIQGTDFIEYFIFIESISLYIKQNTFINKKHEKDKTRVGMKCLS